MMLIEIARSVILFFAGFGFYYAMMLVEKHYGKKVALIVTLTFGGLALLGLLLNPS